MDVLEAKAESKRLFLEPAINGEKLLEQSISDMMQKYSSADEYIESIIDYYKAIVDEYSGIELKEYGISKQAKQIMEERYLWKETNEDWYMLATRVANTIVSSIVPYLSAKYLVPSLGKVDVDKMQMSAVYTEEFVPVVQVLNPALVRKLISIMQKLRDLFRDLIYHRYMLPNTPTLINAGIGVDPQVLYKEELDYETLEEIYNNLDRRFQLSACNVLSTDDSMEGILKTLNEVTMISKAGGGVGLNFGALRPSGAKLSNGGSSSGSISFMDVFNSMLNTIKQGGKSRRGAGLATHGFGNLKNKRFWEEEFSIHPDAIEFIEAKHENDGAGRLSNFNISFSVNNSNDFLKKLENDDYVRAIFMNEEYKERNIKASELLNKIAEEAHKTGDPGLLFLDKANKYNPLADLGINIESTNVCGEIPVISSYKHNIVGNCNLVSIDTFKCVDFENKRLDKNYLVAISKLAYLFLDMSLDLLMFPIDASKRGAMLIRNVGVGVTSIAGTLASLLIPYDSDEGREAVEDIMSCVEETCWKESVNRARVFGDYLLFDCSDKKLEPSYGMATSHTMKDLKEHRRNISVTTIQPSGTVGLLMQTEEYGDTGQAIEPFFSLYYIRKYREANSENWKMLEYSNKLLENVLEREAVEYDKNKLLSELKSSGGKISKLQWIDENIRNAFKTAMEIDWHDHLKMLEGAMKWNSQAISKTINMPSNATVNDVKEAFLYALKSETIKDVTIYRDGSLNTQILNTKKEKKKQPKLDLGLLNFDKKSGKLKPRERPTIIQSFKKTVRFVDNDGQNHSVHIELGIDDNKDPFEMFIRTTKNSKDYTEMANAIGRLSSMVMRIGGSEKELIEQISKIKNWNNEYSIFARLIAETMEEIIKIAKSGAKKQKELMKDLNELKKNWVMQPKGYYLDENGKPRCPVCGEIISTEAGCFDCKACGWSACS